MPNAEITGKIKKDSSLSASVGVGGTLIIVIFVALCLTIFATLSFTTAYSDLKLARKTGQMAKDYYAIHKRAEEKLSEISEELVSAQSIVTKNIDNLPTSDYFRDTARNKVINLGGISALENQKTSKNYSFTIYYESLGDLNQKICVTLNIFYDEERNEPYYEIVSWNLSNIDLPSYDDEVYDLWKGID
nr:hypothetical protein [Sedimentibacter sp.]